MNSFFRLPTTIVSVLSALSLLAFLTLVWNAPARATEPVVEPAETPVLLVHSQSAPKEGTLPLTDDI